MSFRGQLIKAGIDSNGTDIDIYNGSLTISENLTVEGNISGDFTLGDAITDSLILKGRLTTGTEAGAYIEVDATTYQYTEGVELRYAVVDWVDTYTLNSFTGMKFAVEARTESAGGQMKVLDCDCRVNDVTAGTIASIMAHTYIKGSTAKTVNIVLGGESEVEVCSGSGTLTVTTSMIAHECRMRVSSAVATAQRLKCHGMVIKAGDTDGQTVTVGTGLLIENYASGGGDVTWTTGLAITDCITGIELSDAMTDGIVISGAASDSAIKIQTGGFVSGVNIDADGTNAIYIGGNFSGTCGIDMLGSAVAGIRLRGAMTDGIRIVGACSDSAVKIQTGGFVSGLNIDADGTNAIYIGTNFSGTNVLNMVGSAVTGINLAGAMTDAIVIAGACGANGITISGAITGNAIHIKTGGFGSGLVIDADGSHAIYIGAGFSGNYGLDMVGSAVTGIRLAGAMTTALAISGVCGGNVISITGAFTSGSGLFIGADGSHAIFISDAFTGTYGLRILGTASTAGIALQGAMTEGLVISGGCTNGIVVSGVMSNAAIYIKTGGFVSGLVIDANGTNAIYIGGNFTGTTALALAGVITNFFSVPGSGCWSATNASGDAGKIKVLVGGATKYINVYNG